MDSFYESSRELKEETRDKLISIVLKQLADLQRKTDPNGGGQTAAGKDLAAFEALQLAGKLVRLVAGWAIDHQVGIAFKGLSFVPLQPSGTKHHSEYIEKRAAVDRHDHEHLGRDKSSQEFKDVEALRQALYNLVAANPGAIPESVRIATVDALRAVEFGEVPDLFKPSRLHQKRNYTEKRLQLRAIAIVEYNVRLGMKKCVAQESVASAFGVSVEAVRVRTHNQKQTVAAMWTAARKLVARRSYRVAMRRKSFSRQNMRSMAFRLR